MKKNIEICPCIPPRKPFEFCNWEKISMEVVPQIFTDNITLLEKLNLLWLFLKCLQEELVKQKAEIEKLKSRMDKVESDIADIYNQIAAIKQNILEIEQAIASIQNTIMTILTRLSAVENKASQNEQNIIKIQGDIVKINSDIDTLNNYYNDLSSKLTNLTNRVSVNENNIKNIQGDISNINNKITNIQGDISTINSNISSIQGDISNINNKITNIQGDISTINSNISSIQGDLQNDIDNINTSINTINTNLSNLSSRLTAVENWINSPPKAQAILQKTYDNTYLNNLGITGNGLNGATFYMWVFAKNIIYGSFVIQKKQGSGIITIPRNLKLMVSRESFSQSLLKNGQITQHANPILFYATTKTSNTDNIVSQPTGFITLVVDAVGNVTYQLDMAFFQPLTLEYTGETMEVTRALEWNFTAPLL